MEALDQILKSDLYTWSRRELVESLQMTVRMVQEYHNKMQELKQVIGEGEKK